MKNKLDTKDLIYAGAFTAIYVLLRFVIIMTLGLIPIFYLLMPLFTGMVCGTIYMMYVNKIPKPSAIVILASLFGLILLSTGHFYSVFMCIPIGFLAEFVAKLGKYKSKKMFSLSFIVFNLTMVTPFGQMYLSQDAFISGVVSSYGEEYGVILSDILSKMGNWILLIQCASAIVGAIIGIIIANILFKKHFEKAGIV